MSFSVIFLDFQRLIFFSALRARDLLGKALSQTIFQGLNLEVKPFSTEL